MSKGGAKWASGSSSSVLSTLASPVWILPEVLDCISHHPHHAQFASWLLMGIVVPHMWTRLDLTEETFAALLEIPGLQPGTHLHTVCESHQSCRYRQGEIQQGLLESELG